MKSKLSIIECESCYGYVTIKNTMLDQRYTLTHCPYCGSDEVEIDELDITEEMIED